MRACTKADVNSKNPSTLSDGQSNLATTTVPIFETPQSHSVSHDPDFSNDSAAFEDLLIQLKSTNLQEPLQSKRSSESSFVVSDRSSSVSESDSTCDPTFYHRIENTHLKKSAEELVASLRRRLRFDTSSDDTDDQEEQGASEYSSETDTSERCSRFTPSAQSIQKKQSFTVPLSVKTPQSRRPLKVVQSPNIQVVGTSSGEKYSLPFIYSLGQLNCKSSEHLVNRQRHPSAERFLKNFKKNREELANRLLSYYNEVVFDKKLPEELEVKWNERLLKTAGQCVYMRRNIKHSDGSSTTTRQVRIELSGKVCTSAERVRDTLLHEACHAAVWVVHGVNDGHGRLWRGFVRKANAAFPFLPPVTVRHTYAIDTRFTYRCTGCSATINRHSKSLNLEKKVCGRCHSRFELIVNSKRRGMHPQHAVPPKVDCGEAPTPRPRPAFAEFVKEHYKLVREQIPNHKDTMAQLGSMFRSMKIGVNDNVN